MYHALLSLTHAEALALRSTVEPPRDLLIGDTEVTVVTPTSLDDLHGAARKDVELLIIGHEAAMHCRHLAKLTRPRTDDLARYAEVMEHYHTACQPYLAQAMQTEDQQRIQQMLDSLVGLP